MDAEGLAVYQGSEGILKGMRVVGCTMMDSEPTVARRGGIRIQLIERIKRIVNLIPSALCS